MDAENESSKLSMFERLQVLQQVQHLLDDARSTPSTSTIIPREDGSSDVIATVPDAPAPARATFEIHEGDDAIRTTVVGALQRQIVELAEQYGVDATSKLQDDSAKEST